MKLWYVIAGAGLLLLMGKKKASAATVVGMRRGDPRPFLPLIHEATNRHVELRDRPEVYVGLLDQESAFDPAIVSGTRRSPTGALGIAQFTTIGGDEVRRLMDMKTWSDRFSDNVTLTNKLKNFRKEPDATDVPIAIHAGALFLSSLIKKWKGNVEAALTDYNAGGKAAKIVADAGSHAAAKSMLENLPANQKSQSPVYAPEVLAKAESFKQQGMAGISGDMRYVNVV